MLGAGQKKIFKEIEKKKKVAEMKSASESEKRRKDLQSARYYLKLKKGNGN